MVSTLDQIRALAGRGTQTSPVDLGTGHVVRVDGVRYRVNKKPHVHLSTGSVIVDVYSEHNQHDVLSLSARRTVPVLGTVSKES